MIIFLAMVSEGVVHGVHEVVIQLCFDEIVRPRRRFCHRVKLLTVGRAACSVMGAYWSTMLL